MASAESIDDPLLRELLTAFEEDSQRVARDVLRGIWVQAAISLVALFLAVSSTIRLLFLLVFESEFRFGPRFNPFFLAPEIALTTILFVLSLYSLRTYLILKGRYSRLSALAEKLGR